MKWSRFREWFEGWCSKKSLRWAIVFQSVGQLPTFNLNTNSMLVLISFALYFVRYLWGGRHHFLKRSLPWILGGFVKIATALAAFSLAFILLRFREKSSFQLKLGTVVSAFWGFNWIWGLYETHTLITLFTDPLKIFLNGHHLLVVFTRFFMGLAAFHLAFKLVSRKPYLKSLLFVAFTFVINDGRDGVISSWQYLTNPSVSLWNPVSCLGLLYNLFRCSFSAFTIYIVLRIAAHGKYEFQEYRKLVSIPLTSYGVANILYTLHAILYTLNSHMTLIESPRLMEILLYAVTARLPFGMALLALGIKLVKTMKSPYEDESIVIPGLEP